MGANGSSSKKESCTNLRPEQVEVIKASIRKRTINSSLTLDDMQSLLPHWGHWARVAYDNLIGGQEKKKDRLPVSTLIHYADLLEGISSDQAEALEGMFHDKAKEALVGCSRHSLDLSSDEASSLLDVLLSDSTPSLSQLLTSNRLASELVHLPFSNLLGSKKAPSPQLCGGKSSLMSRCSQVALRSHLPIEFRSCWELLFSSNTHGASFSQMSQRVDRKGPCLVIVRSTKSRIFGCFASKGFSAGPVYTGDSLCFLFTLSPSLRIFEPTGFSKKYCYLNFQQETLPNGLGIGGDHDNLDNWPLFLCEEYGKGLSCPHSSSFEKCDLAEMWRVGPPPPLPAHKDKSILDKDPQAQALLELAGKKMHSEAFREPAPLLDPMDEDHSEGK